MELTQLEVEKLKDWGSKFFIANQKGADEMDFEAEIDKEISFEENQTILREKLKQLASPKEVFEFNSTTYPKKEYNIDYPDEMVRQEQEKGLIIYKQQNKEQYDKPIDLDKIHSVAILGDINSGKTNLAFYYMNSYQGDRQKYLFGYPQGIEGYINVFDWNDLLRIRDGIIFIDELQRFIRAYDRKSNQQLMELISMMAHKNNTLIFTTQLSQFITRGVEAFIDCWAICRLDLDVIKQGSKPKKIIQRLNDIRKNDWILDLEQGEFYEYSDKNKIGENKIKRFPFQKIGKDWRND